jgi:nucleotide-binding universal stress UspA family protein
LLARDHAVELVIAHVVDASLPEDLRGQAETHALDTMRREVEELAPERPSNVRIVVRSGKPREEIARLAHEMSAELIVLGRHDAGRSGMFGFTDSTAGHIVRKSPVPALIVMTPPSGPYRHVLVGVDFSIYSRSAIRHATRWNTGAVIDLIHAFQIPFKLRLGTPDYIASMTDLARREMQSFADGELAELAEPLKARHLTMSTRLVEGLAIEALRAEQARVNADLVVIGTHGSGGVVRLMWGSVARELTDDPPCDLLVVHGL